MNKTKLTLTSLALLISMTSVIAKPVTNSYSNTPEPVYGMGSLEKNTIYPDVARDLKNDGYVVLQFHVNVVGEVSNIVVAKSSGATFDQAAIAAVMNTKWNPAMHNGTAVPVTFALPFEFHSK